MITDLWFLCSLHEALMLILKLRLLMMTVTVTEGSDFVRQGKIRLGSWNKNCQ